MNDKLTPAHKLGRGDRVSVDGFWLELVRVMPTNHEPPKLMLLFLNGKSRVADRNEEFLREARD